MKKIAKSELVLNPDGSVYHLNLKEKNIADQVILVGDPARVDRIARHFDSIEFSTQKREFKTVMGRKNGMDFTVISSGIGPDNIDIVLNELDAAVNIDFATREIKRDKRQLSILRMGTSGSLQADIPVDSLVLGSYGLGLDGLLHFYQSESVRAIDMENALIEHCNYPAERARPYMVQADQKLLKRLSSEKTFVGITATAGGFFGPQGRQLRLTLPDATFNEKLASFSYDGHRLSNFEMETSAIYGLSRLMGHKALSINAIIANRSQMQFSEDPYKAVDHMIEYGLAKLIG